jgi:hypothetical protein
MRTPALLLLVGCGSIAPKNTPSPDAPQRIADGPADGIAIDATPSWTTPVYVPELTATYPRAPALSPDMLDIYFADVGPGGSYDIFHASRADVASAWSAPAAVTELSSSAADFDPFLAPDGLTIWFSSLRTSAQNYDIFVATRASRSDAWNAPVPVTDVNTVTDEGGPCVANGGLIMVFHSHRNDASNADIFMSTRSSIGGTWSTPVAINEVNTSSDELDPFLSEDGLTLYVTSNRPGSAGARDIYVSTRPSLTSAFSTPTDVTELATPGLEEAPWVSADGTVMFFSGMPPNGSRGIYRTTR